MSNCEIDLKAALDAIGVSKSDGEIKKITDEISRAKESSKTTAQFKGKLTNIVADLKKSSKLDAYYEADIALKEAGLPVRLSDEGFGGLDGQAAMSHVRNSPYAANGIADNVENNKSFIMTEFKNTLNFMKDAKTAMRVMADTRMKKEQMEILRYIETGGKSPIDPNLKGAADTVKLLHDKMIAMRRGAGMFASKLDNYFKHTHDWVKMKEGGFDKWFANIRSKIDVEASFDGDVDVMDQVLNNMWNKFEAAEWKLDTKTFDEMFGESFSKTTHRPKRSLTFKEGQYADYWGEYGRGTLLETVYRTMDIESRNIALFEKFGAKPKESFERLMTKAQDKTANRVKDLRASLKGLTDPNRIKDIEKQITFQRNNLELMKQGFVPEDPKGPIWGVLNTTSELLGFDRSASNNYLVNFFRGERADATFAVTTGEVDQVVSTGLANFMSTWSSFTYIRTLGSMVLGSIPDAANLAAASVKNFGTVYGGAIADSISSMSMITKINPEIAKTMGFALEDVAADMASLARVDGPSSRIISEMSRGLGKVSGMNFYDRQMSKMAAHLHSTEMINALNSKEMTTAFANNIKRNNLSSVDLDNFRKAIREVGNGHTVIDSERLYLDSPESYKKYQVMLDNFLAEGTPDQNSVKMKSVMTQGTKRGTVPRAALQTLWMFKSYLGKMNYIYDSLHHANVDDSIKNRIWLSGTLMALGWMSASAYDLRDNRKPKMPWEINTPDAAMDTMMRSGMFGIIGDVSFQDTGGNFEQGLTRLLGPLASDAGTAYRIGKNTIGDIRESVKSGELTLNKSRKSVRTLKNYVPFNNQPVIKAFYEYQASDAFLDWVDPGIIRRNKSRNKERGVEKLVE